MLLAPSPRGWKLLEPSQRPSHRVARLSPLPLPADPELNDTATTFETPSGQRVRSLLGSFPRGENERRAGFEPATPSLGSPPGPLERHHGVWAGVPPSLGKPLLGAFPALQGIRSE